MTWTDALWGRSITTYARFRFDDPVALKHRILKRLGI
jgi:hypothetical protein